MWFERTLVIYLSYTQIFGWPLPSIMLPNGTRFHINDTLYSSKSTGNFLNFKYIHRNGYHIESMSEGNTKCLYITSIVYDKKLDVEKLSTTFSRLYHTIIKSIESYIVVDQNFNDLKNFILWHGKLGHLGSSMILIIIEYSHKHPIKNQKILLPNEY